MYQLICTSYNETEQGLVLRNNWMEVAPTEKDLLERMEQWNLPDDFTYPALNSVSSILEGEMELPNVKIHVRIVRF